MASHLLSWDPIARAQTIFHDEGAGDYLIEERTDVTEVIEDNRARYAAIDERERYNELTRVASIPMDIWQREFVTTGRDRDHKAIRRWLDDRDQLCFRTRPGKLAK